MRNNAGLVDANSANQALGQDEIAQLRQTAEVRAGAGCMGENGGQGLFDAATAPGLARMRVLATKHTTAILRMHDGSHHLAIHRTTSVFKAHDRHCHAPFVPQGGRDIVAALCESSATFAGKTEFSQEKYKKRKEKKYCITITLRRPTARSVCQVWQLRQDGRLTCCVELFT